jgi:WD40 repeat protein
VLVRPKQGALGSQRRADHPRPACMLSVAVSSRCVAVVSTNLDQWNTCLHTLEGHSSSVNSVVFSHDSTRLASASDDSTVKIWVVKNGDCLQTLEAMTSLTFQCSSCNILVVGTCQKTPSSRKDLFIEALVLVKTHKRCCSYHQNIDQAATVSVSEETLEMAAAPAEYRFADSETPINARARS